LAAFLASRVLLRAEERMQKLAAQAKLTDNRLAIVVRALIDADALEERDLPPEPRPLAPEQHRLGFLRLWLARPSLVFSQLRSTSSPIRHHAARQPVPVTPGAPHNRIQQTTGKLDEATGLVQPTP
jgi:hypothetical protein